MSPRKEQRPEPKSITKAELPMNDPNYHYRILSKEDETRDRVAYHRELGYGKAKESDRQIVMACKRDEHEQRQQEAKERADRLRASTLPRTEGLVHDETSIEPARGFAADED